MGGGSKRAAAVNLDLKNSCGDLIGHNSTLLCCSVRNPKPHSVVATGEDKEIQIYKGLPFKLEKSIPNAHTGFINNIAFMP